LKGPNSQPGPPVQLIASTRTDHVPQYSPDGKRIAFISARSGSLEVWVSEADGSRAVQLTSMQAPMTGGGPHWSPDGEHIVFDSNAEGQFAVYVVSAEGGKPRRMTNHPSANALPGYSRDGRWIYFSSTRTGTWQIWKMPAEGGEATQVTRQVGWGNAVESPEGKFIYYTNYYPNDQGDTRLWRVPVGGGEEKQVLESVRWLDFAVVDRGIYFIPKVHADGSSSIQFFDFNQGTISTLARIDKPLGTGLSVSPDQRYFLYTQIDQSGSDMMLVENFR
jgi:Tol biopolymer transport system component